MNSNKIRRKEKIKLNGSYKKSGFDRWRLVTNGVNYVTGEEKTFFIEFYVVNPSRSLDEAVLGFKNRYNKTVSDLQFALANSEAAKSLTSQVFVTPSFFMVRAGILSSGARHMNSYYPCSAVDFDSKEYILSLDQKKYTNIVLADSFTVGSIEVSEKDLIANPEFMCNPGKISWNLQFEKSISFSTDCICKSVNWSVLGGHTDFSGTIIYNDEEFSVVPKKSFGYYDKNWGKDFISPFFHISSSSITSVITGKLFEKSAVVAQGEYNNRLCILIDLDGEIVEFNAAKRKNYKVSFDFMEVPVEEGADHKVHWTISVQNRKYVADIDIYCNEKDMFLRDYESPEGGRKVLKVLGSGLGAGTLKLYKMHKKALELIEQAKITKCVCEYGNLEYPEQ